jgi:putative ABC transport system permease protein
MLDRKLVRELLAAKGLLLAITSIITVGVACYVSMQSVYNNLSGAKQRYYRQCRMADFWIDLKKVPTAELAPLAQLPGVTQIQPRIQFYATVDLEGVPEPINGLILGLPRRRDGSINDIVMRRGSYFTERRANEVIVNDAFAREHGIHPGHWIHLLMNNRRQELFVVGTAISSEFTYLLGPGAIMPDPEHFGVFYIKHDFAEEVFDFDGAANQVVGRLASTVRDRPDYLLQQAEVQLEPYGVFAATPLSLQPSNQYLSNEIIGLSAMATVMPVIFLAVAALVLNVLLTRLARQQRIVIGTLKAIGYTDWQIFAHFLKFGASVGLAGAIAGSILGYLCAWGMTIMYRQFFEFPDLRNEFYIDVYIIGLLVSLLCAVLGSLHGSRSMLRLRPAEAMRPEPPRRGGRILLERIGPLWQRLSSGWRMAVRGIFRQRLRTAAGLFAAAMGASLLVCGLMMVAGTDYLIEFQFFRTIRSDLELSFKEVRGEAALLELQALPGVDVVEPRFDVACTFQHGPYHRKGAITGLAPGARLTVPRDRRGQAIRVPTTGVVLTRWLAKLLHIEPGDELTVIPVKGDREPLTVPVAAIADSYIGLAAYADIHYLGRLRGEEFGMSGAQLRVNYETETRHQLYRELKRLPAIESVTRRRDMIDNLEETMVQNMLGFIFVLVLFAGVVFFGSVVNASLVSLAERQREVATLGSLGYGRWEIGFLFLRESLVTNLVGTTLGLPLGYFLTVLMAFCYSNDLIRFPVVITSGILVLTMLLALVFALAAHGFVQWRIHKMDYMEGLKVKE